MVTRHPNNFRGHELMAYAARDSGRPEEAARHFREAIDRFPADPEMLTDAATVALGLRDTASAKRWLAAAVQVSPRAARARTRLYTILRARGDTTNAKALLEEGLSVDPEQHTWARLLREERSSGPLVPPDRRSVQPAMREPGLEPGRREAADPKSAASTNSATPA
jgi:tetratricopeptide (TPR) repeat protein